MNILVRNLSRAVTERELVLMFMKFGTVKSFNIVTDKKTGASKGFGFVDMPEESEARAAIKALDGKFTRGQKLRVKSSTKSIPLLKEYSPEGDWEERPQPREIEGPKKERSSAGKPAGRFSGRPAERSIGRRAEKSYERPSGRTSERSTERPTGRPTRRFSEKPAERFSDRPAGKSTVKSTHRPKGRPTERSKKRSTGRPVGRLKR